MHKETFLLFFIFLIVKLHNYFWNLKKIKVNFKSILVFSFFYVRKG
jgi:hypothetical protein